MQGRGERDGWDVRMVGWLKVPQSFAWDGRSRSRGGVQGSGSSLTSHFSQGHFLSSQTSSTSRRATVARSTSKISGCVISQVRVRAVATVAFEGPELSDDDGWSVLGLRCIIQELGTLLRNPEIIIKPDHGWQGRRSRESSTAAACPVR